MQESFNLSCQDIEAVYTRQVLDLLVVARDIREGRTEDLADRIESTLEGHLSQMMKFQESPNKTACFYLADELYAASDKKAPETLKSALAESKTALKQILSKDCFAEASCGGGVDCHKWPTSLRPVDPDTPDVMGWHYIIGSHCGFSWPFFWKRDCGLPLGLKACTG